VTEDFLVDTFDTVGFMAIDERNSVTDSKIVVEMCDDVGSQIRTWITGK
jgi:hypothetical protein